MSGERNFAVKVETHDGTVLNLRFFSTKDEAESYPVKLARWKRVWVEAHGMPKPYEDPPFPWTMKRGVMNNLLVAADGRRLAMIYGTVRQREYVGSVLRRLGADYQEESKS